DPDEAGVAVVTLAGELDLTNVEGVEDRLEASARGLTALVVDLNGLVFVGSASLHFFFRLGRTFGPSPIAFVIRPGAPISRALDVVGFRDAVTLVSTVDEARAALDGNTLR